jgi:hypothetical protein
MNDTTPIEALNVDVSTSMVAIVTLVTVIVFGLATLARPSRATITWGAAFALGMLGTYLWIGGFQLESPVLKAGASGLMVCFEPIVWLGLRMHLGKRTVWWPVVAFAALAPLALALTAGTPAFQVSFRVVFLTAGVFAALIATELFRMDRSVRDIALPLALASCAFVVVALVGVVAALVDGTLSSTEQLDVLRGVNGVGTVLSSTCAAFTIVLLVRTGGPATGPSDAGEDRARRRLLKAQAQNDLLWSVLDVRLDDEADLRAATTAAGFALIADRFHDDVDDALPVSADAERVADGRSVILIRGSAEAVEHHIRAVLGRISAIDPQSSGTGIRVSASVGWADVTSIGYDYDALVAAASRAAVSAREDGGDRWSRAAAAERASDGARSGPATLEP